MSRRSVAPSCKQKRHHVEMAATQASWVHTWGPPIRDTQDDRHRAGTPRRLPSRDFHLRHHSAQLASSPLEPAESSEVTLPRVHLIFTSPQSGLNCGLPALCAQLYLSANSPFLLPLLSLEQKKKKRWASRSARRRLWPCLLSNSSGEHSRHIILKAPFSLKSVQILSEC